MRKLLLFSILILSFIGCQQSSTQPSLTTLDISKVISKMTQIMVNDVSNPPLASRFFSYATLAGYEIVSQNDSSFKSMYGMLNDYPLIKKPDSIKNYSYPLAALLSIMETASKMQPSGKLMDEYKTHFLDSCKRIGFSEDVLKASQAYASFISGKILAYAKADRYNKISNYSRYIPHAEEGYWYPTPPAYLHAVEPYFNTVRPFALDSCTQFKPVPPTPFSKEKNSAFYKLMLQNYNDTLTPLKRQIAGFWDCNPFAVKDNGHLLIGLKKISPGAHWLGITGIACKTANKSFNESMKIHTLVSIGLMDGFICCWDEKYRSNRIRPETAIRKYIDVNWIPLLQTPPFPEYLSGHSTISAASSTILTALIGDNFQYTDTVEVIYGLEPRKFNSFKQAAQEAAISRFYGGIHFIDAIENGYTQGEKVGNWIINKVETPKSVAARRNNSHLYVNTD